MSTEAPPRKNEGRRLLTGPGAISSDGPEPIDDASETYTLEEGINAVGVGKFQNLLMLYVGFAWMSDAMEMMLLSFLGPEASCYWGLTTGEKGAITSVVFIGMTFGAYTWGALADAKGRRFGFFGTAAFTAVFGFASALAPNYWTLLFFRGMVGFGLGGVPVSFGLFLEFIPSANRGRHSIILQSAWTIGALVEAALAWIILPIGRWRALLLVSTMPLVLLLVFFPLLPESPHYLLTKGEVQKAEAVLARMAKHNKTQLPSGRLASARVFNAPVKSGPSSFGSKVKGGFGGLVTGMKKIFSPALRRTSILLHYSWVTNAITYYGLVLLTTELHAENNEECDEHNHPTIDAKDYRDIFITTMAESIGLVLAYLTVDRLGRLKSMAGYLAMCGISLVPLIVFKLSVHQATGCLFAARAGIVGSFTIIYTYTPEVYPTAIRSFGLGFANAWSRFGGLLSPLVAVELVDSHHTKAAESILIVMCFLAAIATLMMPFETAGQELKDDEIEMTSVSEGKQLDSLNQGAMDMQDASITAL